MFFCPLSSGSKGNAIFMKTKKANILIDAGISFLKLTKKLNEIDVNVEDIDAVLITHEHSDHVRGLKILSEKLDIPIITNADTAKGIYHKIHHICNFHIFSTGEEFEFKDLLIHPFSTKHDTLDPVGYIIKNKNIKIGVCTDLGFVTTNIRSILKDCDYLYIEANHSVPMVHSSNRSYVYKQRVVSRQGHLSNDQCFQLLDEIMHDKLKHIYLAHISEECNSKKLLEEKIVQFLKEKNSKATYSLAHQDKISKKIVF